MKIKVSFKTANGKVLAEEVERVYFYTRKQSNRIVCECISMNNRQTKQYLNLLRDMYGRANVLAVSNSKCLLVEQFINKHHLCNRL